MFRYPSVLAFLLLLFSFSPAHAAVISQIEEDFKPVSGYVIMPVDGEYIIDLDASKGVAEGDLFSVVESGEKIVHPVTKEVLGTLDEVKSVLQVTRVKSGYSYTRSVGEARDAARGDKIRRYESLRATFWDYTAKGEGLYADLRGALPHLEWRDYRAAQAEKPDVPAIPEQTPAHLYFILRHDGLEVRGPAFQVIHAYESPASVQVSSKAPQPEALPAPVPAKPSAAVEGLAWEKPAVSPGRSMGYSASFPSFNTIGTLPERSVMADFTKDDGRLLMAATDGSDIRVYAVGGELTEVARGDTVRPGQIYSLHWWRPDPSGPFYLAATYSVGLNQAYTHHEGDKAVGAVFRLDGDRLIAVREEFPYILGSFDLNNDGNKETLLGQAFDRDIFFGQTTRVDLAEGKLSTGPFHFDLPPRFPVQGSCFADLTGDGQPETIIVRNRTLSIYSGDKLLYESPQEMGGSLSRMNYYVHPGLEEGSLSTQVFEVPPIAHDIDGDGVLELMAISSEDSALKAPGMGPGIKAAWLSVYKYREGMFVRGKLGVEMEDPIQGLHAGSQQMLIVVSESGGIFSKGKRSYLLGLPISQ